MDVGAKKRRLRRNPSDWQSWSLVQRATAASMLFLLALAAGAPVALSGYNLAVQAARTAAWLPEGPPCRQTDAAAVARHTSKGLRTFAYEGVTFGRYSGHVACEVLISWTREYVACRFKSPQIVTVSRAGSTAYFEPEVGKSAAVLVGGDTLVCVNGGA